MFLVLRHYMLVPFKGMLSLMCVTGVLFCRKLLNHTFVGVPYVTSRKVAWSYLVLELGTLSSPQIPVQHSAQLKSVHKQS